MAPDTMTSIIYIVLGLVAGGAAGYLLRKKIAAANANTLETKAENMLTEARTKQQQILLEAKDKAMKYMDDAKREEEERRRELKQTQDRLSTREATFDKKLLELEERQEGLRAQVEKVRVRATEIEGIRAAAETKLAEVARLTAEEAKQELFKRVEESSRQEIGDRLMKLDRENSDEYEMRARRILSTVMERYAAATVSENATSVVELPSEDMKGRIIGKEGRNVRMIERLTGCEFIIDDTPGVVTISSFAPIRRQVAKLTLEKLIKDGRIQPARIEAFAEEAKKDLAIELKKAGENALYELGITGTDPKLVSIAGRLKYRTSFGQNQLMHAMEVAYFCEMLAKELGADPVMAKKAGFFHDIGKAVDHETQGGHPEIGYTIMKKFGYPEEIAYCCIAHHEDKPKTLLGSICKVADALSGARPGARRDSYEQYIHKLEDLENIATRQPGVEKAYAIQAGREIRVFVNPAAMDDFGAYNLAKAVAHDIAAEMKYPGEVKVTVIRETRVIEYAR